MRGLKATPMGPGLPPLVAAEARSDSPHRGLPGIEPEQPNQAKTTAGSAGLTASAHLRSYSTICSSPQHAYQPQVFGARSATSLAFIISHALPHQHHA
jgi:hypothetical protein